jgi:hypothetical protein
VKDLKATLARWQDQAHQYVLPLAATIVVCLVIACFAIGGMIAFVGGAVLIGVGIALGVVTTLKATETKQLEMAAENKRLAENNAALTQTNHRLREVEEVAARNAKGADSRALGYHMAIADFAQEMRLQPAVPPMVADRLLSLLPGEVSADA